MVSSKKQAPPKRQLFLVSLAKGEYGLDSTLWNFGVIPLLVWCLLIAATFTNGELFSAMIFSLTFLLYSPFEVLGLIQSARVNKNRFWSHVSMLFTAMWILTFVVVFFIFIATL